MAEVTATQVMALRKKTDLPMMDCKAALTEAGGDQAVALEILHKKYRGKFDTKAERETTEGLVTVYVEPGRKSGGMVELRCETAQVAKTEAFTELAQVLAKLVAAGSEGEPDPEVIMAANLPDDPNKTVKDYFGEVFGKLGENMVLARCRRVSGEFVAEYSHYTGKVASLVALDAVPSPESVGRDLCQHVAFTKPSAVTREDIPDPEKQRVRTQARQEALEQGKPERIVDKIAEGRLNAWYAQQCLTEQEHVKVTKTSVGQVLKAAGVEKVTDLAFFELGVR